MPRVGPVKRHDLIRYLRRLGFAGPYLGGSHAYMTRASLSLRVPNPHQGDISANLPSRLLRQADIPRDEWERL